MSAPPTTEGLSVSPRRLSGGRVSDPTERYRAIVETAQEGIVTLDAHGITTSANPAVAAMLGVPMAEIIGLPLSRFLDEQDRQQAEAFLTKRAAQTAERRELRFRRADGGELWALVTTSPLLEQDGSLAGSLAMLTDISEIKRAAEQRTQLLLSALRGQQELEKERDRLTAAEERLRRAAFYDPLTGLPNRSLFRDRLEHALAGARREQRSVAVLFLDLDGFKLVNDSFGHGAGDVLLNAVGYRLGEGVRSADTIARFGGDEFTVLLDPVSSGDDALHVADGLLARLNEPFRLSGATQFVAASIGIAISRPVEGEEQAEALLREADVALYQAKSVGRGRAILFAPGMSIRTRERAMLETDLHQAVRKQQLRLYYQPIVDLASDQIAGMEALVRWDHPSLGLLAPDNFIPIAEDTGLIYAIDTWVLDEACRQLRTWQAGNPSRRGLVMSVNMSGDHLRGTDVFDRVVGALQTHELEPACLKLEVTESAVIRDATSACRMLQALKAAGVQLAIDDFGVGYSSLSYLRHFSVDTLKIDRSFVTALGEESKATAIVQAVTLLAHTLGLNVTVEGIETPEQAAEIRRLGCDFAQGFYFGRPLAAGEACRLLG